jgi:hypothetical protein
MTRWFSDLQKQVQDAQARERASAHDEDVLHEKAKTAYNSFLNYKASRDRDIDRAISRRICAGDMGLPFLLIDTVFAVSITGHERGKASDLNHAIEDAKDEMWFQCRHLGGDAVLHADFRIERGIASFVNGFAVAWNFVASFSHAVARNGSMLRHVSERDSQATISVFAQGSAVRLLPHDTQLSPQVYERFDKRWLNMALPPGVSEVPSPYPVTPSAPHQPPPQPRPSPTLGPNPNHADHDPHFEDHVRAARRQ